MRFRVPEINVKIRHTAVWKVFLPFDQKWSEIFKIPVWGWTFWSHGEWIMKVLSLYLWKKLYKSYLNWTSVINNRIQYIQLISVFSTLWTSSRLQQSKITNSQVCLHNETESVLLKSKTSTATKQKRPRFQFNVTDASSLPASSRY